MHINVNFNILWIIQAHDITSLHKYNVILMMTVKTNFVQKQFYLFFFRKIDLSVYYELHGFTEFNHRRINNSHVMTSYEYANCFLCNMLLLLLYGVGTRNKSNDEPPHMWSWHVFLSTLICLLNWQIVIILHELSKKKKLNNVANNALNWH